MATLGLIPDPKRVMQLRILYGKSSDFIKQQIFSIDILNYTDILANKIRRNIQLEVQKLNLEAMRWSKVAIPESYNQSVAVNKKIFTDAKMKPDPDYNTDIHQVTKDKSISVTQRILLKANRSIMPQINIYLKIIKDAHKLSIRADLQEFDIQNQVVVNEIIRAGLEEQLNLRQISKNVAKYLRLQFGAGEFIRIKGRNYKMRAYSEMVARTQMRLTQSLATRNISRQYNNDLVTWSIHLQDHVDDLCAPYAGKTYSWSGNSKKFAKIPAIPPTHPNCEHFLRATPQALVDLEPERFISTANLNPPTLEIAS
jgi:hypothetical protein